MCFVSLMCSQSVIFFFKIPPSFSLTEFSTKFKCQIQFQHCFIICYSGVSASAHSGVSASAYATAWCFSICSQRCFSISICYSLVFQHLLSTVFQHILSLVFQHILSTGVSAYTQHWCFSLCYSGVSA